MTELLFDKFEIIETLKKDQHTSVYLANHIYLGKKIILKTLTTDNLPDKTIFERFKREAKILAKLDHPNLIKVLDFGTAKDQFYISFEYFESDNLRKIIKENRLDNNHKKQLCIQLFKALDIAHQNGIIHRDIKPENILVNKKLELKIADFGLALIRDEHLLTQKTSIVGTPGYMSPEQIRGENLTQQTDMFSSGIVIFELFTGNNPFIGRDINETVNKILNFNIEKDLPDLSLLPSEMQSLLNNLLRKNFSRRIKNALEALSFLGIEEKEFISAKKSEKSKVKAAVLYLTAGVVVTLSLINIIIKSDEPLVSDKNHPDVFIDEKQSNDKLINSEENIVKQEDLKSDEDVMNEITESGIKEDKSGSFPPPDQKHGRLFVEVNPWAEVHIDNRKIDTTPLESYIQLDEGKYNLTLIHPDYPSYSEVIEIRSNEAKTIKINFAEQFGFLNCNVFPWGEIFIDGMYKSTTPLQKPVVLTPGKYNLIIRNPEYMDIEKSITIAAKETLALRINFGQTKND